MRIDAHLHFWRYRPEELGWIEDSLSSLRRDFLPRDVEPELAAGHLDACIAVQARQTLEETRWLLQLAEEAPFVAGVVGWVDLRAADVRDRLTELARNPKLVGVRHVVQAEPDDRFLLRPDFLRGIAALGELGLTYDLLVYPRHLPVATELVRRFPDQRFVVDHLAKPAIRAQVVEPWASRLRELARSPNAFCKLSGMVTEADWTAWKPEHFRPYLEFALETFGPERLLFGSDWPVCTVAASYVEAVSLVADFLERYPRQVREQVLGESARRIWRLPRAAQRPEEEGRRS
jgi:L-fuconolactonase